MIEVQKAWHDAGNFKGFITLRSSAKEGIFIADQQIDRGMQHFGHFILFAATEVIYQTTGDYSPGSKSMKRIEEFAKDVEALNAGDPEILEKYVAIQPRRDPISRYEAVGKAAMASFRFGDGPDRDIRGRGPQFYASFIQEYSLVEAPAAMLNRASR